MQKISPFLWFHDRAEEAVDFYLSVFKNGRILRKTRYAEVPQEDRPPSPPAGTVMTVEFELFGQHYTALNGGPMFTFNESISFVVSCETQEELDRYWEALLTDGGTPVHCGWLKDKFGVIWQVIPTVLTDLVSSPDPAVCSRVTQAMLKMIKLDIATLQQAAQPQQSHPQSMLHPQDPASEIISTRVFNMSRDRLFDAFSDPKQLAQWWGPKGFTNTFDEFDFRPGGDWKFTMHGPDGKDYANHTRFIEIAPAERIVYEHIAPHFRMTITLGDAGSGTHMIWCMQFETAEICERFKPICVPANEENFDRLAAFLG
ncbi:VOC family protein [Prosthecobacter sp.]|uniref:VOC family protein n=1 Tax=Prosthecobacter sp. TaxID=1965333 RepID=UPI0037C8743C